MAHLRRMCKGCYIHSVKAWFSKSLLIASHLKTPLFLSFLGLQEFLRHFACIMVTGFSIVRIKLSRISDSSYLSAWKILNGRQPTSFLEIIEFNISQQRFKLTKTISIHIFWQLDLVEDWCFYFDLFWDGKKWNDPEHDVMYYYKK